MKEFPPYRLDIVNQCLWLRGNADDERILLTPKAFAVLRYLVEHAGRLVTQDELLEAVWPDTFVQPEVLKYQIADIRSKLGDRPKNPLFIETLPRRGYRFVAAVTEGGPAASSAAAIPAQGRLVGRGGELGELRSCLQKALKGQRQIVFITGEPGIGKTALVDEFQRQAAAEQPSLRIARGQCVEGYGGTEAYYPMLEALGNLCRSPEGKRVVEILAAQAPTWLVQFPALVKREQRQTLQQEILGATRDRMLREIREALDTLSLEASLLLVFEDLQWTDPSTVDLISALARQRTTSKTMVVITKRPVDMVAPDHPLKTLKQDLLIHHLCKEIALAPLSEAEVVEYLRAESTGDGLPDGFAELIHRHSEGNPLFMVAALDHMIEHGLISRENGRWRLRVPIAEIAPAVPETLRQMIEAQIDHLTAEEQRALEVASVAGAPFTVGAVAAAMNVSAEPLEEFFDRLARRSYGIRAAGSQRLADGSISQFFEFVHAVYREVLYRRQTPARRATLHRRIGEGLEARFSQHLRQVAAELAHHFEEGSDWGRAVKYLKLQAETAGRRFAPLEAAAILQHAHQLCGRLPEAERAGNEIEILQELAVLYHASFDTRAIEIHETVIERAAQNALVDVEVQALIDVAFPLSWVSARRSLDAVERALQLGESHKDPLMRARTRASCLVRRIWVAGWNARDAEECQNALAEIRNSGDRVLIASHLIDYNFILWSSSRYREAKRNAVEGLPIFFEIGEENPYLSFGYWLSQILLPWTLLFLGEWGEALNEIKAGISMADKNGGHNRGGQNLCLYQAWVHFNAMDFAGALKICESVLPVFGAPGCGPWRRFALILAGSAETALGDSESAHKYLSTALDEMERETLIFDWYLRMMLESGLTELWLAKGDLKHAQTEAERFLEVAMTTAERTWQALAWEANARVAKAELRLGRAQDCIGRAVSTMEGYDLPLAAWRVHATAAETHLQLGNLDSADYHRQLSRATILKLANSLAPGDPLRDTFLTAPRVAEILGAAAATIAGGGKPT